MDGNDFDQKGGCPVMHSSAKHVTFNVRSNRDWWPNQLNLKILHQHSPLGDPMGEGIQLCRSVQETGSRRGQERPRCPDDRQPGLVASGLWPLRPDVCAHGVALCRDLPDG